MTTSLDILDTRYLYGFVCGLTWELRTPITACMFLAVVILRPCFLFISRVCRVPYTYLGIIVAAIHKRSVGLFWICTVHLLGVLFIVEHYRKPAYLCIYSLHWVVSVHRIPFHNAITMEPITFTFFTKDSLQCLHEALQLVNRGVFMPRINILFYIVINFCIYGVNSPLPEKMATILADDIFISIFLNEDDKIPIQISLKPVARSPMNINPALVQVMTWRRLVDKPLLEPVMIQFTDAYMRH